jgi:hypothetical protein
MECTLHVKKLSNKYKRSEDFHVRAMKIHGIVEIELHSFLIPVIDGDEMLTSRPSRFTLMKEAWYSFNRRLGEPQRHSGRVGEDKGLFSLLIQPVA